MTLLIEHNRLKTRVRDSERSLEDALLFYKWIIDEENRYGPPMLRIKDALSDVRYAQSLMRGIEVNEENDARENFKLGKNE